MVTDMANFDAKYGSYLGLFFYLETTTMSFPIATQSILPSKKKI